MLYKLVTNFNVIVNRSSAYGVIARVVGTIVYYYVIGISKFFFSTLTEALFYGSAEEKDVQQFKGHDSTYFNCFVLASHEFHNAVFFCLFSKCISNPVPKTKQTNY